MKRILSLVLAFSLVGSHAQALNWGDIDLNKAASGSAKLYKAAAGLSDADEIAVGREVAANLVARYSLVEDPAIVTYVNLVGSALVRNCSRSKLPFYFGVLRTAEVNAFAAPGGYIFVTEGLLATLEDESELAGVLAHEISHVTERHIVKAIRQANLVSAGQDLAEAGGSGISQYGVLSDFSIKLLSKGLSRKDELAADSAGTVLAASTGYNPEGLRRSVERLGAADRKGFITKRFNRTHPPAIERLAAIDKTLKKKSLKEKGQRLPTRFNTALKPAH